MSSLGAAAEVRAQALKKSIYVTEKIIQSGVVMSNNAQSLEKKMNEKAGLLQSLDPLQREAAKQQEGTLCLVAGAGSGKTTTVSSRIALAVEEGAWNPSKTAAIAFSNQAALSLKARLSSMTDKKIRVSTFHSLAFSQLRRLWSLFALSPFPSLIDEKGSALLLKEACPNMPPSLLFSAIKWAKSSLVGPGEVRKASSFFPFPLPQGFEGAWEKYEELKREKGAMDFDDIFLLLLRILKSSPEARGMVARSFESVTVDEYQDVSPAQHAVLKFWTTDAKSVCVVGDPAQSIYSFAGSSSWFLEHAKGDFFPPYRQIFLSSNYRSGREVIRCANSILAPSPKKYVSLKPALAIRGTVLKESFSDFPSLASRAADLAKKREKGKSLAILARSRRDLDALKKELSLSSVPFCEPGSESKGKVVLSTIHAAKGLEWDRVIFAVGTENVEPSEEERRIVHVACTRAKGRLDILFIPSSKNLSRFLPFSLSEGL